MAEIVVKTGFDPADIAYGIVEDYILDGPEFLDIVEAVQDNGGEEDTDAEAVALIVRKSLTEIARTFSLTY